MIEAKWYAEAKKHIGLKEIPGPKHNQTILGWIKSLGGWFKDDETPWCGTFLAHCLKTAGLPVIKNWFRAKEWATYGRDLGKTKFYQGSILVFGREGGGHVGFCAGYTDGYVKVLGGNQSNGVNYSWLARDRLLAQRWPDASQPEAALRYVSKTGPVSTNEA